MYAGLPIVTNKITEEEQRGITHHLLGFIDLEEETWRVGMFKRKASQIIQEIRSRGRLPILVGGTHYYTQSLLFDNSLVESQKEQEASVQVQLSIQEISEKFPILDAPTEDIIARLREVDPIMADRWHPKDRRKIRRSLEIFLMTGRRASDIYTEQKELRVSNKIDLEGGETFVNERYSPLLLWVHADSSVLKKRLDARVDKMVTAGLIDEVKSMDSFLQQKAAAGSTVDQTRGIWVSIGFKEFEPFISASKADDVSPAELSKLLDLSIEQTQAATRQYAKSQVRWIRLKLIPALKDEGILPSLYLLDGTDIANWTENVSKPSIELTKVFLAGGSLPGPLEVCAAAAEFLDPDNNSDGKANIWFRQECQMCGVVSVTDLQWQTHLKSRRHRGVLKKKQKNEARSKYVQDSGESDKASRSLPDSC